MSKEIPTATLKELRGVLARWAFILVVLGVFAVWATWRMSTTASRLPAAASTSATTAAAAEPEIEYWTCTMHPQIHESGPGEGPICGMPLVEKYVGSDEPGVKPTTTHVTNQTAAASQPPAESKATTEKKQAWYRCTMPECGDVGSSDPDSRCPVCGMKRELVDMGGGGDGEHSDFEITLNERARHLAEVETVAVQERLLYKKIHAVGRVGYDETRYKMVSAWIGGRIDKLFADFTGMVVTQGDHLVEIYSPELLSAQEEFLQALRATDSARTTQTEVTRRSSQQILNAARRKLELLGVTDTQIADIETSSQPQTHLVVYAPLGGTVVKKQAMEGMYVKTGDQLYTIADLRHLWLLVDLYESDLPWVKPFQRVRVTTRSLPGEMFTGEIFFVNPSVNPRTRTVEVRIHVDNPALRLKPDMWVAAEIDADLTRGGRGTVPDPGGDYACPMHPWETADQPGDCPVCKMALVPVTELPQFSQPTEAVPLISVPRDAVMQTGERALVYVESAPGTYRGVEVTLGPLAQADDGGEYYPILAGLTVGEQVVSRGNFAIDSQMQLAGKPSLFTARGLDKSAPEASDQEAQASTATCEPPAATDTAEAEQTICPVMGLEINPDVFIEYKGVKVYFCCWGCDDKFRAEPEKYIPKLPESIQKKIQAASASPASKATASEDTQSNAAESSEGETEQTICPVMELEINPDVFIEYKGVKVYFCCWGCDKKFRAEPEKYIPKLPESVQKRIRAASAKETSESTQAETAKQTICPVMGLEINPEIFTDYHGVRVYFCCRACIEKFNADPNQYIPKLPAALRAKLAAAAPQEAHDD